MNELPDDESESLGSMESVLTALAYAPGGPGPLVEGETVAEKYVIESAIGRGGMGVVYRAKDTRLHRTVALKLGTTVSASALARLEQEAQTLAKLSHPNVVVIHEVGEHNGRVFVAMEHATGGTARTWLAAKHRSWREIVSLYAAAGDGLAAAHDLSIVHRDFKADNVLVGADDRPRVADFGLARAVVGPADADAGMAVSGVVGTLPYMAPEQLDASALDARADQFSFCASLWEALFDARPFEGRSRSELRASMAKGPPRPPRNAPSSPPGYVLEALRRGLSESPADRFPSMRELLAELRRDPLARWRRAGLGALAVLGIVSIGLGMRASRHHEDPCDGGEARQSKIWSAERAAQFEGALAAAGGGAAAGTLRAGIDAYSKRWVDAERDACRATRVVGTQSEAILDRRMGCLRRADTQLASMLEEATSNPHTVLDRPGNALAVLPPLERCADVNALAGQAALPADPAVRAEIDTLSAKVAKMRSRFVLLEAAATSLADADAALADAKRIGWPPLVADVAHMRASVLLAQDIDHGRAAMEEAVGIALSSNADELAARAATDLASSLENSGEVNAARRWLRLAQAESARIGDPPAIGAEIAGVDAALIADGPHPADALPARRKQLELVKRTQRSPIDEADGHMFLAMGLLNAGDTDAAGQELDVAMAQIKGLLGKDHPALIIYDHNALRIAVRKGHLDDAVVFGRDEVRIAEAWYGPDALRVAGTLEDLSAALQRSHDLKGSADASERGLRIVDRLDSRSVQAGELQSNAALIAFAQGNLDEAASRSQRALEILEAIRGKESPRLIEVLEVRSAVLRAQKNLDGSESLLRRSIELADRADRAADGSDVVNPRVELSYTLVAAGRATEAAHLLESVVSRLPEVEPRISAEFHSAFADALFRAGQRARAHEEGVLAVTGFDAVGKSGAGQKAEAEAWLRTHPAQ